MTKKSEKWFWIACHCRTQSIAMPHHVVVVVEWQKWDLINEKILVLIKSNSNFASAVLENSIVNTFEQSASVCVIKTNKNHLIFDRLSSHVHTNTLTKPKKDPHAVVVTTEQNKIDWKSIRCKSKKIDRKFSKKNKKKRVLFKWV